MGRSIVWFSLAFLVLGASAFAQLGFGGAQARLTVEADRPYAAPGGLVELRFRLDVSSGAHIYSRDFEGGKATRFALTGPGTLGEPTWPLAAGEHDAHKGLVVVRAWYTVPADAAKGPFEIRGVMNGQVCDDKVCNPILGEGWTVAIEIDPYQVDIRARVDRERVAPGGQVLIVLEYRLPAGSHVYSESQEQAPTRISLRGKGSLGEPAWPAGEHGQCDLPFELQMVYTVPGDALEGTWFVDGRAEGDVCDPRLCWNYDTPWSVAVVVDKGGSTESVEPTVGPGGEGKKAGWQALLTLVLPAISAGLLTLLMPCTFPMIPITISVFTKGGDASRWLSIARGLVYGAGIVGSYTLIGLVADLVFGGVGQEKIQGFALNPWLNLAIAIFFIYFAGAFFGFYELKLPESITGRAAQGQAAILGGMTLPGIFLLGTLFMITSYSCGAPFVFTLFTTAASSATRMAVTFALFVFSVTLALPFVILSMVPRALESLPSSGGWMTSFKVVMGFLEIAFALKFLSNTDLWFGGGDPLLLSRRVFLGIWIAISILIVIYLLGRIRFPHEEPVGRIGAGRAAWIVGFGAIAGYLAFGVAGHRLQSQLEAFFPGRGQAAIRYEESWAAALAKASDEKKEIFVHFTGHT